MTLTATPRQAAPGILRRRTSAKLSEDDLAVALEQVAMVLSTGVDPQSAWKAVAHANPGTATGLLADRLARTPASLLRHDRDSPLADMPQGRVLILCLIVCETTGAALAGLLGKLAHTLRDLSDAERSRVSAFAGARTTAHILMALPLLSLGLGYAIGANPLSVLLGSVSGYLMLAVGTVLMVAGWVWMRALLAAAAPEPHEIDPVITLELIAHTVASGLPLSIALTRIGESMPSSGAGRALEAAGQALGRGASPGAAFNGLTGEISRLRSSVELSHHTGAPLAPLLRAESASIRRLRRHEVERASQTLNVRLVLPTGLTILPAFVILGIVPVITDLLTTYFGWL